MSTQKDEAQLLYPNRSFTPVFITWNLRVFRILTSKIAEKTTTSERFVIHHLGKPKLCKPDDLEARWAYEIYSTNYNLKADRYGYLGSQRWLAEELTDYFKKPN